MRYALTVVIVLLLLGLGVFLFALSGTYDIAATQPHWGISLSFITMLRDRSIAVHSQNIKTPNLDDEKLKRIGLFHFHEMCRLCHGAPGYKREEFAQGLYPVPPSLTTGELQQKLSSAEIYWIVNHGIKLTGMPAFSPTHSEEEMWGIVSFVDEVPKLNADQYQQMIQKEDLSHVSSGTTSADHR